MSKAALDIVCTQQTFVGLQYFLKTSSRHVFITSSRRLQRNNFFLKTSCNYVLKTSSRRLQDVLRDLFKTSSRRLERRKIVTLKTSWRRLEEMSWRRLQDMSWRRFEDVLEINKMFTRISILIHGLQRNLNQYLTNLYLTNLYFRNLRRIQNTLIRTQ